MSILHTSLWLIVGAVASAAMQDSASPSGANEKVVAPQIKTAETDASGQPPASDVYWSQDVQVSPTGPSSSPVEVEQEPVSVVDDGNAAPQLTSTDESDKAVAQLSQVDLNATLAQLSEAERQVLLQAIEGTDICDNPPDLAAIKELCETRIETRSSEFGARAANTLSPEERLLGESLEQRHGGNLAEGIERLARNAGRGDANSLDTQAIASVALGTPQVSTDQADTGDASDLTPETQALVNAIVQQLSGGGPQ